MQKNDNLEPFPCELEVRNYFYDYHHSHLTGDHRPYETIMITEQRAPNNPSHAIFGIKKDEDLLLYSLIGLDQLQVFGSKNEEIAYRGEVKLWKKMYL